MRVRAATFVLCCVPSCADLAGISAYRGQGEARANAGGAGAGQAGGAGGDEDGAGGVGGCGVIDVLYASSQSFSNNEVDFKDVLSVTVPGGTAPNGWIALLSGRLGSGDIAPFPNQVQYRVDDTVRGVGETHGTSGGVTLGGPWQHFDYLPPLDAGRTLTVEFRSNRIGFDNALHDLRVVVFPVPEDADVNFVETPDLRTITQLVPLPARGYASVENLNISPLRDGEYLVLAVVNARETPGIATVGVRMRGAEGEYWPIASGGLRPHLANPTSDLQSFMWMRPVTTDGSQLNLSIEVDASSDAGSEIQFSRMLALRTDAFRAFHFDEQHLSEDHSSVETMLAPVNELTVDERCGQLVVAQAMTLWNLGVRRASFEGVGTSFEHTIMSEQAKLIYAGFGLLQPTEAITLRNLAATSNALAPLSVRDSVIIAIGL